jgi:hypothetical protein
MEAVAIVAKLPRDLRDYFARIGRKGGRKGGKARAQKLSKEELSAAGKKAVQARWAKTRKKGEK